jgi:hypothetical protein
MVPLEPTPIDALSVTKPTKATGIELDVAAAAGGSTAELASGDAQKAKSGVISQALLPELIKAVHGSCLNVSAIATEFCKKHPDDELTKASVSRVVNTKEFCVRELRSPYKLQRRFVLPSLLLEHGLSDLPLPEPKEAPKVRRHPMPTWAYIRGRTALYPTCTLHRASPGLPTH